MYDILFVGVWGLGSGVWGLNQKLFTYTEILVESPPPPPPPHLPGPAD